MSDRLATSATADPSHLAIMDAAHNALLTRVLLELEASVSIGAPAHLWGEPATMRQMELWALHEHEELIDAIADGALTMLKRSPVRTSPSTSSSSRRRCLAD